MARRICAVVAVVFLSVLFLKSPAQAVGLGGYVEGAAGTGTWNYDTWGGEDSIDLDSRAFGGGFVFDTTPYAGGVFAYRLGLGYEQLTLTEKESDDEDEFVFDGVVLNNGFNFGLVRTEIFRLWIGPQLRLGYFTGEADLRSGRTQTADMIGVGGGLGIGAQVRFGSTFGLGLSTGARYMGYFGTTELGHDEDDFDADDITGYLNLTFLFDLH